MDRAMGMHGRVRAGSTRRPRRAIAGALAATTLLTAFAAGAGDADAARRATDAEARALAAATPAAVRARSPRASAAFRRCFRLRRASAKRSEVARSYLFGFVEYRQGGGACAAEDASYGFIAIWRVQRGKLRYKLGVNQGVCSSRWRVPLAVQREAIRNCSVVD